MYLKQNFFVYLNIVAIAIAKNLPIKRGLFATSFDPNDFHSFQTTNGNNNFGPDLVPVAPQPQIIFPKPAVVVHKFYQPISMQISSAEIASAIQAAKEVSNSVLDAQKRVQEAKEAVIHQQHLANQKQQEALLTLQKTEAAAAIQQQQAKSAATAVIQAQQHLAQAKVEVAELQRIAAAKEAHAADIIKKSAAAAAVEVQRKDDIAKKISAIQSNHNFNLKQATVGKDGSLLAASVAVAASADHSVNDGGAIWDSANKFLHIHPWG